MPTETPPPAPIAGGTIAVFAVACGLAVGNLYYAQPLLETIGRTFGVDAAAAGLIVTITQLGYAIGLILIAPLGDLVENRRLIVTVLAATVAASLAAAFAPSFAFFLAAALTIGLTSVVAQILVPLAAFLAPPAHRGRVVGQVMGGLLAGILLARAVAGIVSGFVGWRAVYVLSAAAIVVMVFVLLRVVPRRQPAIDLDYRGLLASLARIYLRQPVLRRRAAYQSAMFGSFSAFWTSITFLLAGPLHRFTQPEIGLFGLAGAIGALFAPIAGRLGDRGYDRPAIGAAFLLASAGFALTLLQTQILGARVRRDRARSGRADDAGLGPARGLRPRRRRPQPPQHALHRNVLLRRCRRIGTLGLGVCARGLAGRRAVRRCASARRVRIVANGATSAGPRRSRSRHNVRYARGCGTRSIER